MEADLRVHVELISYDVAFGKAVGKGPEIAPAPRLDVGLNYRTIECCFEPVFNQP